MAAVQLKILYCDNHLLVACKPAGMPSQPDRSGDPDLLTGCKEYVKERFRKPGRVYLGLVHRLDRPVSGVMVLARTSKAAARLSGQFREREVDKRYMAVVEGVAGSVGRETGYLHPPGSDAASGHPEDSGGAYAELTWTKIAEFDGNSILEVKLVTGRKHQIRQQLASMGHPVVGDLRYGARTTLDGRNIALHAYSLSVFHPTRKIRMSWQASPPASWGEAARMISEWMQAGG